MTGRLRHLLRKELIQTLRDPRMRLVILAVPLIQTLVFGYAVSTDVNRVDAAVVDRDRTRESRSLVQSFTGSPAFVGRAVVDMEAAAGMMDRGRVDMVLSVPQGFGEGLGAGDASVQVILDGSSSGTAGTVMGYANDVLAAWSRGLSPASRPAGGVELRSRAWFNPELESRNFYLPGVVVTLVTIVTLMLSSMAVVREKEIGTIEQISVTPISRAELILGKLLPFAAVGMLNVALVVTISVLWFAVPFQGSIAVLMAGAALFLLSTLGMGLLISTVSSTQQQAMLTDFLFIMPAILLSGFVFPISNMPWWAQGLSLLNPLRYMLVIVRGVFLRGAGMAHLWPQMAALAALGVALLAAAVLRFRKRVG
ncbi:MAG: ABC transporter permease [Candidatus Fermentibacteraceae bacterium]